MYIQHFNHKETSRFTRISLIEGYPIDFVVEIRTHCLYKDKLSSVAVSKILCASDTNSKPVEITELMIKKDFKNHSGYSWFEFSANDSTYDLEHQLTTDASSFTSQHSRNTTEDKVKEAAKFLFERNYNVKKQK